MLTAGYEFYRGTYHGDKITAAEWPVLSRDAAACLEELTLGRTAADLAPELLERCQMALCAVAEEYKAEREEGAGVVASESVGSWSRTYAQTASPAQKRRDAAWMWLGNIDNDESRVIEFYPTDVSFAENFYALAAEFEERQNDIKARSAAIAEGDGSKLEKSRAELALTREAFAFLREGIDRTFGPGTAQTVFGSRDSVAMAARFFRGVTPYIRKARQGELDRYLKEPAEDVME